MMIGMGLKFGVGVAEIALLFSLGPIGFRVLLNLNHWLPGPPPEESRRTEGGLVAPPCGAHHSVEGQILHRLRQNLNAL